MGKTSGSANTTPQRKPRVVDDKGGLYELGKRIAEGGQGIVCPTQDPRFLVKVSRHPADDPRTDAWSRQIAAVQRMPIEENDLPIAMPVALISKPRPGYVMELMDGLVPLEEVLRQAHERLLAEDSLAGFLATGGLARRLRLLARLGRVLARLHGLGIAHGDLSPKNVFVSRSVEHDQVWLIDCDNLTYAVRNSDLQIYTPDYGAPEIFRGELGISTYTDIWSFAVMAFQTLTLLHPFKSGALVDTDSELEAAAFRGDIPWIDHDGDERNRASAGLPREIVCTPQLAALFRRCFQDGLRAPERRPVMAEWAQALEACSRFAGPMRGRRWWLRQHLSLVGIEGVSVLWAGGSRGQFVRAHGPPGVRAQVVPGRGCEAAGPVDRYRAGAGRWRYTRAVAPIAPRYSQLSGQPGARFRLDPEWCANDSSR